MSLGPRREEKEKIVAVSTPFLPEFPLFSPSGLYWAQSGSRRVTLPGVPSSGLSRAGNVTEERSGKGYSEGKCEPSSRAVLPRFPQWRQVTSFHWWRSVEVAAVTAWGSEPAHPFSNTGPGF